MNNPAERIAIVTGANGAIGQAICQGLAAQGFEVAMVCRSAEKAKAAAGEVERAVADARLRSEIVDLSRKAEIFSFAGRWRGRLDVLVNNAAIAPRRRR